MFDVWHSKSCPPTGGIGKKRMFVGLAVFFFCFFSAADTPALYQCITRLLFTAVPIYLSVFTRSSRSLHLGMRFFSFKFYTNICHFRCTRFAILDRLGPSHDEEWSRDRKTCRLWCLFVVYLIWGQSDHCKTTHCSALTRVHHSNGAYLIYWNTWHRSSGWVAQPHRQQSLDEGQLQHRVGHNKLESVSSVLRVWME